LFLEKKNYSLEFCKYYIEKFGLIRKLEKFFKEYRIKLGLGLEIEFYSPIDLKNPKDLEAIFRSKIKEERGVNQYEICTEPVDNYQDLIDNFDRIKVTLKKLGFIHCPKPFKNSYGNGVHLNISLSTITKDTAKARDTIKEISGYICHETSNNLLIFINDKDQLERLEPGYMAPTHISYGFNNRFAMIRIPYEGDLRIEHRLLSFDSEISLIVYLIYKSINKFILYDSLKEILQDCKKYEIFGTKSEPKFLISKDYDEILKKFDIYKFLF